MFLSTIVSLCVIFMLFFFSYDDTEKPYIHFATKTAYRFNQNKDDDEIKHEGIWLSNVYTLLFHLFTGKYNINQYNLLIYFLKY